MTPRPSPRAIPRRLVAVGGLALVAVLASPAGPAVAAGGRWGAGGYPYRSGAVCAAGSDRAPLVSWDVGTAPAAFLTGPVSSDGSTDSAVPPLASAGVQQAAPVAPGQDGFSSAADIAAYAALLAGPGTTGDDAAVAAVARQVMLHAGAGAVPSCAGPAAALLTSATDRAGPYTVHLSPAPKPAIMGVPDPIVATVRSASGQPVPGLRVDFSAGGGQLGARSVPTGAAGTATATLSVADGSGLAQAEVTASVSAPVGLEQVSVVPTPSPTDPSGAGVPAIYPAPPVTASATAEVGVDQTADPAVVTHGRPAALAVGASLRPQATITGLRGHRATLAFTVYGPEPLDASGGCRRAAFTRSSAVASTTDAVPLTADQTVTATPWSPTDAGCYSVQARVDTTDAEPAVSAASGLADPGALVTVIAATARLGIGRPIAGAGALRATLTAAHTNGAVGGVAAAVLGPLPPGHAGSCAGLDWSQAARNPARPSAPARGDGAVELTSTPVPAAGCYQWTATLALTPGSTPGSTPVPVPAPGATVLVLTPHVSASSDQTWSVSPHPVDTHVSVSGTYGQPAHVEIQMHFAPTPITGCRGATWTHSVLTSTGPSVGVRGPTTSLVVPSGTTPRYGCYEPVPRLVMDANPAVSASGAPDVADNAIVAGVDVGAVPAPRAPRVPAGSSVRTWVTVGIAGLFEIGVVIAVAGFARRERTREGGSG